MTGRTLSLEALAHFVSEGFTVLRAAFPSERLAALRGEIDASAPVRLDAPQTWSRPYEMIARNFGDESFWTWRALGALDDLLGVGRYRRPQGTGWILFNLPGFASPPWQPPKDTWHIDGVHFQHHLTSPEQALIALTLWSDVDHGGGATVVKPGSHCETARLLAAAGEEGYDVHELSRRVDESTRDFPIQEVTGAAGDLLLMHPFLYHGSSANVGVRIRTAANLCVAFEQPMDLAHAPSPVERAIADALNVGADGR